MDPVTTTDGSPISAPAPGLTPGRIAELDQVVARSRDAANAFRGLDQETVDRIVRAMVVAGLEHAVELAMLAVEETGFGVVEDKVVKNYVATEFLYDYLRDKRSVGVIDHDAEAGLEWVAEPIGVVMAITPVTNPTSTVLFKAIVAAKTRNAILFRPSPRAVRCAERAAEILREAGEAVGLPRGALQVIPDADNAVTHHLFGHPGIDFIWTTGGPKIVSLANSAGKPAISVGPGNAPVYLHRSADVPMAVVDILISKTFDASVICPAEQTCVVDAEIYDAVVDEFERMGAKVLASDEVDRVSKFVFGCDNVVNLEALGQPAGVLAHRASVDAPDDVKVLIAPLPSDLGALAAHPLVREKLMPILGLVKAYSVEHAVDACVVVSESGGLGHTSAVYARDEAAVQAFASAVRTGRILVNAPTAVGALGGVYNNLTPTFSLGCGTWGGSLTTENVNYRQLLNIKVVSRRRTPPQWFRVRGDVFISPGSLEQLRELGAAQVVIVTDAVMDGRGLTEEVRRRLDGARNVRVFAEVPIEPDEAVITAGVDLLDRMQPDAIVAIGGGSVMDAAKVMRLLHEHPECSLHDLSLPFLDARKRVADYPQDPHRVTLVAIPTTSGTGSEVSPAAVVSSNGRKITLVDYTLVPDIAIVDPNLTLTMPPALTADTGIDALTHALEAVVSIFATPYTDAFCVQAARLILDALPKAYADGSDLAAREAMANAATIAGLAFANAFVGVNHALAHAVGARFGLSHGRVNGIFLPHVMRYNASLPTKFMPAPGYGAYVAPDKYATLGRVLFGGRTSDEQRRRLFTHVDRLLADVGIPGTLREAGVDAEEFEAAIPDLLRAAFEDPSVRTNPRMPLLNELLALLRAAYGTGASPETPAGVQPVS
ncbi:MAG TPA: bifunctional acetaldehyde-CoA/alcohol dehydrogenase [Ilumatobacteraceae bacterium]|nr:bifunctional acetaldehyde-CoA/alcohol dehydrogenase [Ilumatobacteraceae bacterium]